MLALKLLPIDRDKEAVYKFLSQVPIFDRLSRNELYILLKYMHYTFIEEGQTLFEEGEPADYLFFVAKGALDVVKSTESGDPVVLSTLRKGRSVGEMAIIEEVHRSATIVCRAKATLLVIGKRSFERVLLDQPNLGIKVLKGITLLLSQNLRKTSSRLADYMLPTG